MMPSKNNGFTASDIERYHSGKMSPEERHALEKAALDDPFLADALEGYAFTPAPSDDLAKIQSRLNEKFNQKKVVPLFQKYKWLSVAAIVLIIAGAGWIAYSISGTGNSFSVAVQKNAKPKESPGYTTPQQTMATDSNKKNKVDTKLKPDRQSTIFRKNHSTTISNNQKRSKKITSNLSTQKEGKTEPLSKEKTLPVIQIEAAAQNKTAFNDGLINSQNEYLKKNNAAASEPRVNSMAGKVRGLTISNDSASNSPAPIGTHDTSDTIKDLNIVLHSLPMDSTQTVVLARGTKRKSLDKYPHVIIDTLEPAGGYVSFDDYIADNLQMPDELKDKPTGEVQLSFTVDKDGQPTNITVVKSLCQKCDEEAIRLLKEGPKWKKKKNKKGKITIRF